MASGQTVVTYNGITIWQCLTKKFEETAVYDDSNTDILYHQFTITVVGYVTGDSTEASLKITPVSGGGSAAGHHKSIRDNLLAPRGFFTMTMGVDSSGSGGTVLLRAEPHPGGVSTPLTNRDVNNGPKPRDLSITHVASDQVHKVEMTFELAVLQLARS